MVTTYFDMAKKKSRCRIVPEPKRLDNLQYEFPETFNEAYMVLCSDKPVWVDSIGEHERLKAQIEKGAKRWLTVEQEIKAIFEHILK